MRARRLLAEARGIYEGLPDRLGLAAVDNSMGRLELAAAGPEAALAAHRSALTFAREISNPLEEAEAHLGLARAFAVIGSPADARAAAHDARNILVQIGAAGVDRVDVLLTALNHTQPSPRP